MDQEQIKAIMAKEPLLTNHGIGSFEEHHIYTTDPTNSRFIEHRKELLNNGDQIDLCIKWLSKHKITKVINRSIGTSEIIKTHIEKEYKCYITNGSFIIALIHLGIPYDSFLNYPFVDVGLEIEDFEVGVSK